MQNPENKFDRKVLVIPRETLFQEGSFSGFRAAGTIDYRSRILASSSFTRRGDAEQDPRFKQPICCAVVLYRPSKTVFFCQKLKGASESRLHGTWSCCIGGHVEEEDAQGPRDILEQGFVRERDEELEIVDPPPPHLFGYLNDDSTEVSKVHFGVMYLVELATPVCRLRDTTLAHGSFRSIDEIESMITQQPQALDDWARLMIKPLKEHFPVV
ncbi:hypothetical protein HY622_02300 [Candidatus Uhrbacteria bacterium]|nr:hypothetical protein [Candidatus Uhrbacteria bacterium]